MGKVKSKSIVKTMEIMVVSTLEKTCSFMIATCIDNFYNNGSTKSREEGIELYSAKASISHEVGSGFFIQSDHFFM